MLTPRKYKGQRYFLFVAFLFLETQFGRNVFTVLSVHCPVRYSISKALISKMLMIPPPDLSLKGVL